MIGKKIWKLDLELYRHYDTTDVNARLTDSDLTFKFYGYYLDGYQSAPDPVKMLNSLTTKNIDWSKINTIYRYPHLALSRDKMIALKDKYNIKIIRDSGAADLSVVSEKTFEKLINYNYYNKVFSKQLFLEKMDEGFANMLEPEALTSMNNYLGMMSDEDYIQMSGNYSSWNNSLAFSKSPLEYLVRDSSNTIGFFKGIEDGLTYVKKEDWESFNSISNTNRVLVSDVYVNEICSEDSITLDWELYNNVSSMLEATREDRDVAMVMMSNCNIETSKTALGLLFYHHGELMKSSKTWNQVAFKTLRKQFDHYSISGWNSGHTSTYSNLTKKLVDDDSLTEEAMEHICDLAFQKVICNSIGMGIDGSAFELKRSDIRMKPEYLEKVKIEKDGVVFDDSDGVPTMRDATDYKNLNLI